MKEGSVRRDTMVHSTSEGEILKPECQRTIHVRSGHGIRPEDRAGCGIAGMTTHHGSGCINPARHSGADIKSGVFITSTRHVRIEEGL